MGFKQTNHIIGGGDEGISPDLEAKDGRRQWWETSHGFEANKPQNRRWRWRNQSKSGGQRCSEAVVELMSSHGDRRTQRLTRGHTVVLVDQSCVVRLGAAHGCLGWLSMEAFRGSHELRLFQCCGCHGSHGFSGVNVIWRE